MPRFSAALNMLYAEHPALERFAAAAADGFRGVEFQSPYAHTPQEVAARLADSAIELVLINTPAGDAERGERGLAALPGREADFRAAMDCNAADRSGRGQAGVRPGRWCPAEPWRRPKSRRPAPSANTA